VPACSFGGAGSWPGVGFLDEGLVTASPSPSPAFSPSSSSSLIPPVPRSLRLVTSGSAVRFYVRVISFTVAVGIFRQNFA
jgi:hypothetical protein